MRIIDALETGMAEAEARLRLLRRTGYEALDLGAVVRDVAALWERCLKASDPTWAGKSLYEMTRLLKVAGWVDAADALDQIRFAANRDKHEAAPVHDIEVIRSSLRTLADRLRALSTLAPGLTGTMPEAMRVRSMVCAIYEYFHTGETEYVFLEAEGDDNWLSAGSIDRFQVLNKHCRRIEASLAALPGYAQNPPELKDLQASLLESDEELWQVIRMDASYAQVHDIVAPFQHSRDLLGGLHREDDRLNVVASLAGAELSGGVPHIVGRGGLDVARLHADVRAFMGTAPARLTPLRLDRCTRSTFEMHRPTAVALDERLGALITTKGVLLVLAK